MKNYLKVAEDLQTQRKQLLQRLKNEGIPALKARMEEEGVKILYIDSLSWEEITLDDVVARAIVMEDDELYVYGSYWSYECGEMDVDDAMECQYSLEAYSSLLLLVPALISEDSFYEESKKRPQDVNNLTDDSEEYEY